MFLFPYESIKKDSNVVIYGAGTMGMDYILQILRTGYCRVVFALDRAADEKTGIPVETHSPEFICSALPDTYDYVLIALQDVNHSISIKESLLKYGVEESKIVQACDVGLNCTGFFPKPKYVSSDMFPDVLHVSIYAYGGMGDTLIATALIKAIRKMVQYPLEIDYFCSCPDVYRGFPFIDHVYKLNQFSDRNDYDLSASVFRNVNFHKMNPRKIKRVSESLYRWCMDILDINEKVCNNFRDDCRYSLYAEMKGKNRMEQHNINGILPYDRHTPVYMEWDLSAFDKLHAFGLEGKHYITICPGIENCNTMKNPKLWELEKYNELVQMIKERYADIMVVGIGQNYNFGKIEGVDIDIVGQTSLDEAKVVLKQGILHIGVEGGLIHLNHFLYGKSCCLFGPTSKSFFGYPENINLHSNCPEQCKNGCEGIVFNWMSYGCFLDEKPICMKTLMPGFVFENIAEYLDYWSNCHCLVMNVEQVEPGGLGDKLARNMVGIGKAAIIGRVGEDLLNALAGAYGCETIIFDRDMGEPDRYINNGYAEKCRRYGLEAEYGNIYNIPALESTFDVAVSLTLCEEEYVSYALKELLRIVKESGVLLLYSEDICCLKKDFEGCGVDTELLSDWEGAVLVSVRKTNKRGV